MRCIALIPIYKPRFDADEERNIRVSLENLKGQDCVVSWLAPNRIERSYYDSTYPGVAWSFHDDRYFRSIQDYSRLLLTDSFYETYYNHEFMLILQPDAVVLKPTLNEWLDKPYDYVGAPWPKGWEYPLPIRLGDKVESVPCRAFVGNGGLSLRRSRKIVELLQDFPEARSAWVEIGNPEDLLISMVATLSGSLVIPTIGAAARFSIELEPSFLQRLIGNDPPLGMHGRGEPTKK
jgi:hypothetical protein